MLRPSVGLPDLGDILAGAESEVAGFITGAMRDTTGGLLQELRDQVEQNGLGRRLANTWRGETYPHNRNALNPAGYVWSNAPAIIDAFSRGSTIRPVNGANYLWIPTKNVPLARARVDRRGRVLRGGRMTPEEVENQFNRDLDVVKGKGGGLLAFMDVVRSLNGRAYRPATRGRAAQGRKAKPVLMFTLRRTVTMPRLLDLGGAADRAGSRYETNLNARWR